MVNPKGKGFTGIRAQEAKLSGSPNAVKPSLKTHEKNPHVYY
jgi:hypothetical protein